MLLPRLAHTIARPRIAMWLARNDRTPLRMLVAPAGCGKTNAIVNYLRTRGLPFAYCAAAAGMSSADVFAEIATSLGLARPALAFDELIEVLADCGNVLVAVENIDVLEYETRTHLARLVEQAPEDVGLIYTARTWNAIDVERIAPRGLAAICDDRMLAFNPDEIAMLAERLGVPYVPEDARRLSDDSEGWAIVAAAAVREAAESGSSLARAYDHWQEQHGYLFQRFVDAAARELPGAADGWHDLCSGTPQSQPDLEQMRRAGLFIRHDAHGYHYPYRVVERIFARAVPVSNVTTLELAPLVANVLGEFHSEIGSQEIRWIRRRDQQIFLYLLLKEEGSASRVELCERFWPGVEPELRAASLRVACSNMRRAIANIVGSSRVDRYLRTDGDIALNFANVSLDARRFRLHAADGEAQYVQGNHAEALVHFRLAEKLYAGRIGWCAQIEDWVDEVADTYEATYLSVLDRLVALHRRADDAEHLFEYAQKAAGAKFLRREGLQTPAAC